MATEIKKNRLRIAEIMRQKGMTLSDLAAKITRTDKDNNVRTVTPGVLSLRINGKTTLSNLYEIADALGVKITQLFPEEDQVKTPVQFNIQTVCPTCGAKINASVSED